MAFVVCIFVCGFGVHDSICRGYMWERCVEAQDRWKAGGVGFALVTCHSRPFILLICTIMNIVNHAFPVHAAC